MVNTRGKIRLLLALFLFVLIDPTQGRNTLPKLEVRSIVVLDIVRPDIGIGEPFAATIRVTVTHDAQAERLATFTIHEKASLEENVCNAAIQHVTFDGEVYQHLVKTYNEVAGIEYVRESTKIDGPILSMDCKLTMVLNARDRLLLFRDPGDHNVTLHASNDTSTTFVVHVRDALPQELRLVENLDDTALLVFLFDGSVNTQSCDDKMINLVDRLWASYSDVRTPRYFPALVGAVKCCAIRREGLLAIDREMAGGPAKEPREYWDSRYRALRPYFEKVDLAPVDSEMIASLMWIHAQLVFLDAKYAKTQEERQTHVKEFERLTKQITDSPYAGTVRRTATDGFTNNMRSLDDVPIK